MDENKCKRKHGGFRVGSGRPKGSSKKRKRSHTHVKKKTSKFRVQQMMTNQVRVKADAERQTRFQQTERANQTESRYDRLYNACGQYLKKEAIAKMVDCKDGVQSKRWLEQEVLGAEESDGSDYNPPQKRRRRNASRRNGSGHRDRKNCDVVKGNISASRSGSDYQVIALKDEIRSLKKRVRELERML